MSLKLITIYFNISISEEIVELLKSLNVVDYTQIPRLIGVGKATGPRLDNHTWPGANSAIQTVVEESTAVTLMNKLQEMRDSEQGKHSGIFAVQSPVERALR